MAHGLACPDCRSALAVDGDRLGCPDCSVEYPVDDRGIVHLKGESFEYAHTSDRTSAVAERIRSMGPAALRDPDALRDLVERDDEFSHRYALDPSRFDWTDVADVAGADVLDLGCGFGGASIRSARRGAASVLAVDGSLPRLELLAAWADAEGLSGVQPVHADLLDVAFQPERFDVAIFSGSLEWVGAMGTDRSPPAAQRRVLEAVRRGLDPAGTVLVAIENRLSVQHFLGFTSHVTEPPFTPLLPRRLADAVTRLLTGEPYDVYTYSYHGYRRLFESCGFEACRFYYPLPNYQTPRFLLSSLDGTALSDAIARLPDTEPEARYRRLFRLLDRAGVAHLFVPAYVIRVEP